MTGHLLRQLFRHICLGVAWAIALPALPALAALETSPPIAEKIPRNVVTLLYRKEDDAAPNRLDATVQAATRAIEKELIRLGYKVPQTPPDVLKALDRSPSVIVNFAPDAGFSMVFSVYKNLRPDPGINIAAAEVAISSRVFVGSSLLSVEEGRSVMRTRVDDKLKEFGERRAMELAAQKAAANLMQAVDERLRQLTPAQLEDYASVSTVEETEILEVEAPSKPPVTPSPQQTSVIVVQPAMPQQPSVVIPAQAPVVTVPPATQPLSKPARRHAVIIGVSDYSYSDRLNRSERNTSLPGVGTDIRNMKSLFDKLGFAPSDITVLFDADATASRVTSTLDAVAKQAGPDDLIAVYISGHGLPVDFKRQGMSRPALYDFSFAQRDSAPDFEQLLTLTSKYDASRVVMIIDTCHSGGASTILPTIVISSRGLALSRATGGPAARTLARAIPASSNIAVLAAAKADEVSIDQGEKLGGLFTQFLIEGLLAAPGQETLRETVERRVAAPVIERSRESCKKLAEHGSPCPTGQQTPTLGFSGKGDLIRF